VAESLDLAWLLDPPHPVGAALDHRANVERFVVPAIAVSPVEK
jgi:hypothetical protein